MKESITPIVLTNTQMLHDVMDQASCGIFIVDKAGIILELNQHAADFVAGKKNQIIGRLLLDYICDEEKAFFTDQHELLLKGNIIPTQDFNIKSLQNQIKTIEFSTLVVTSKNKNLLVYIGKNVTERNDLRKQVLLNAKLATLGVLAAALAHEVNNPLAWILENLTSLEVDLNAFKNTPEKLQIEQALKKLIHALQGAESIKNIVASFKDFARNGSAALEPVDLHAILNNVIDMVFYRDKQEIQIEKQFSEEVPDNLLFNAGKLKQVFINLSINAVKAARASKKTQKRICIKTSLHEKNIQIDFIDNGDGIKPEILQKLFKPFFTTREMGQGSGLGLYISQEIVASMGGSIKVKSTFNEGATFSVCLPKQEAALISEKKVLNHFMFPVPAKRILIIDDEPNFLNSLKRMLGKEHHITMVLSGKEAMDLLVNKQMNFDLIISDLSMSEVNGMDIYDFIHDQNKKLTERFIFMTGGAYSEETKVFLEKINNECLEKPFDQKDLIFAIQNTLSRIESNE